MWFAGCVVGYNAVTHLHEIAYEQESEHSYFNLLEDITQGNIVFTDE